MDESTSIPIYKPSVVFFGEMIPQEFYQIRDSIIDKCDLLVVLGNSLKSKPVSDIISDIDNSIPQILINKEVVGPPNHFDICLIGDCDEICGKIAQQIGMVIPVSEQQRKKASVIATDQLIRERKGIMIKEEDEDVDIEKDNNETLPEQNDMAYFDRIKMRSNPPNITIFSNPERDVDHDITFSFNEDFEDDDKEEEKQDNYESDDANTKQKEEDILDKDTNNNDHH
ncbi:MAG: hypothetical protein EZS28_032286 [Streblomastix strix]|uniref:Deacetylase sirtuin-type domain-containing protein n=1 Tax=Streblomastix strix TaxID=222440 RepID=A0A5J4UNA9_9EUKA|nr:MAG: hypothetical protein EZS28_032286 [Streblomastix strix]